MSADDTDDGESDEDPLGSEDEPLESEGEDDPLGPGDDDPLGPSDDEDPLGSAEDDPFGDDPESTPRDRLEEGADRAIESFDEGVIDLLSWMLDTDTRARIYVFLRKHPASTSKEVAEGTGLYPSTVREALAELHDEEIVTRSKRQSEGAGNNPYEYSAIPPSELVGTVVDTIQYELNELFSLDEDYEPDEPDSDPVTITVQERDDEDDDDDEFGADDDEE